MAWITDAVLKSAIASRHQLSSPAELPDHVADTIAKANASAYGRIRGILLGRGFTAAQLDQWDDRVQWNTDVGLCFAEWKTADPADRPQSWEELKQLLEDLETTPITIDGVNVSPTNGRVGYGSFRTTDDTFVMPTSTTDGTEL